MEKGEPYDKGYALRNTDVYNKQKATLVKNIDGLRFPKNIIYFKTAESEGKSCSPNTKASSFIEYLNKNLY
jgi:site-specific DNA-methyltransferase (adenine-specific)